MSRSACRTHRRNTSTGHPLHGREGIPDDSGNHTQSRIGSADDACDAAVRRSSAPTRTDECNVPLAPLYRQLCLCLSDNLHKRGDNPVRHAGAEQSEGWITKCPSCDSTKVVRTHEQMDEQLFFVLVVNTRGRHVQGSQSQNCIKTGNSLWSAPCNLNRHAREAHAEARGAS